MNKPVSEPTQICKTALQKALLAPVLALCIIPEVHAQGDDWGPPLGAVIGLETHVTHTDNFYYSVDNPKSAAGIVLLPRFSYAGETPAIDWELRAEAESAVFNGNTTDNYTDTSSTLKAKLYNGRSTWKGSVNFRTDHDPFGLNRTAGSQYENRELDQWRQSSTDVIYGYGLDRSSPFAIELRNRYKLLRYTTNEDVTTALNRTDIRNDITLSLNLSPKTALLINPYHQVIDFDQAPEVSKPDRSAQTLGVLVGATWSATAKTSGTLKIGMSRRSPDDGSPDFDGSSWAIAMQWSPTQTARFRVHTNRSAQASYRTDTRFLDVISFGFGWNQQWTSQFQTAVSAQQASSEFVGAAFEDESRNGSMRATWALERGLSLFAEAKHFDRTSTKAGRDTTNNIFLFGFDVQLN